MLIGTHLPLRVPPLPDEIYIVGLSTHVVRTGKDRIPLKFEMAAHGVCFAVAVGVFLDFGIRSTIFFDESYPINESVAYDNFEGGYTYAWFAFFAVVVALWIHQRLVLRRLLWEWDQGLVDAEQSWDRDLWNTSDQAVRELRERRRLLLAKQKEAYLEVVQPLAPYVLVFLLFCVPAVLIILPRCQAAQETGPPCMYNDFDIIFLRYSQMSQLRPTPHTHTV